MRKVEYNLLNVFDHNAERGQSPEPVTGSPPSFCNGNYHVNLPSRPQVFPAALYCHPLGKKP